MDDLVWYWHHGEFSKHPLVHIDGDWSNCAIENLKQETSIIRPYSRSKKADSKDPVSDEDKPIRPEEKLVAAIIKNALWHAKQDVKKMEGPLDKILETSEPCRFVTGQDDRLEFLTSVSLLNTDEIIRLAYKELEEVYAAKRIQQSCRKSCSPMPENPGA